MPAAIATLDQAATGIENFVEAVQGSDALQSRLPYARAWYVLPRADKPPLFGPSKFIGYREMDAATYIEGSGMDGRETERILSNWYTPIDKDHPLFAEYFDALTIFLGRYGKTPSSAMRLNLPISLADASAMEMADADDAVLADLLIATAVRLPLSLRRRVAAAIV